MNAIDIARQLVAEAEGLEGPGHGEIHKRFGFGHSKTAQIAALVREGMTAKALRIWKPTEATFNDWR